MADAGRFRLGKTNKGKEFCIEWAVPKSTFDSIKANGRFLYTIFWEYQGVRTLKVPTLKPGSLFKDYDFPRVESLDVTS